MNILFYRYGSIYEPDMIDAFISSGLNVIEIKHEITYKNISDQERIDIVRSAIEQYSPAFVYGINYYPAISEICKIYNVIYISQTVDSPVFSLFDRSIRNSNNRIFLFDREQYRMFNPFNPSCIFHLPLASAVDRFDKVISSINVSDKKKFEADISFVGSTYREKDNYMILNGLSDYTVGYIEALIGSSLKIYGYYPAKDALNSQVIENVKKSAGIDFPVIEDAVADMDKYAVSHRYIGTHLAVKERELTLSALARHFNVKLYTKSDASHIRTAEKDKKLYVCPSVNTLYEMPKVFNLSKINLNITMRPIESGLPLRCFDILGCGGFLMTNYQSEIDDMFVIGQDLEAYSCLEELIDKCAYYLSHESERIAIAKRGYEKVCRSHTHIHRIKEMLSKILC